MKPIVVAEPNTPAWLSARATGIGASEIAAAAGLSQWASPLHIYARKRGELPELADNRPMRLGRKLEPIVVEEYCLETGEEIEQYPVPMLRAPREEFILATPDAMLQSGKLVEVKTTSFRTREKWGAEGSDDVPAEYNCQAQAQLYVTGRDVCEIACLVDGRDLRIYRVERNDQLIAGLLEAAADLWERIKTGNPPEPTWGHSRTTDLIRQIHGTVDDRRIALSEAAVAAWEQYEQLGKVVKAANDQRDELKGRVLHEIGDAFAGVLGDGRMIRRKLTQRKGYVVDPTEFIDVRAVKYDGGSIDGSAPEVFVPDLDISERFDRVHDLLTAAGFTLYETSSWGSRYYVTDDGGERVRVSDHAPNAATLAWMERRGVHGIRVDADEFDCDAAVHQIAAAVV